MLQYYNCMLVGATSTLISPHWTLVLRGTTVQRANGGYVVRAFGFLHLELVPVFRFATQRAQDFRSCLLFKFSLRFLFEQSAHRLKA